MSVFKGPDPKPAKRIKNTKVMKGLHARGVVCVLCGNPGTLHHVYARGQGGDDVPENLVGLCGDGVRLHHGAIENGDVQARMQLGEYLMAERADVIFYIQDKLGEEAGREWLRQRFLISI